MEKTLHERLEAEPEALTQAARQKRGSNISRWKAKQAIRILTAMGGQERKRAAREKANVLVRALWIGNSLLPPLAYGGFSALCMIGFGAPVRLSIV